MNEAVFIGLFKEACEKGFGNPLTRPLTETEIAHFVLFNMEGDKMALVEKNLAKSALKIEKNGNHFRFLYTAAPMESFAFKEITNKEISIHPRFIGLFAIQGWTDGSDNIPACFDSFDFSSTPCDK